AEHYEGGVLETQCSQYNFELRKAEKKRSNWTTEVEECRQKKANSFDPFGLFEPLDPVSSIVDQRFANQFTNGVSTNSFSPFANMAGEAWESVKRDAKTKATETTESVMKVAAEKAHALSEGEQMILVKKREGEAAFARARQSKSESGWNEAKAAAVAISNYWNGIVENIKSERSSLAVSQEEATFQKAYWMEKSGVAEVKALGPIPCNDRWETKRDRADAMMTMIRNKVWPFASKAMKAFIANPSEARMRDASAYAPTSAYAYAYASVYAYASDSASAYASASVYASASASAYAYAAAYAAASTSASTAAGSGSGSSSSAASSAYASAYAYAYAYVSTASKICAESASDATDSAQIFETIETTNTLVLELTRKYPRNFTDAGKENIAWSLQSSRETADFARAVIAFKREQEASNPRLSSQETATREQNSRIEQGKLSEIKALANSPCDDDWRAKGERANAVSKMTREKFGSPVSPAMKEFIAHPSEATLRATGKSVAIAMSSSEAEEALETAEIFAKISSDGAELGRKKRMNAATQENIDWSATITREIVEFARAVANFKKQQEKLSSFPDELLVPILKVAYQPDLKNLKENAAEAMRKSQEARSNERTTTGSISISWHHTANSLEKTAAYWTKAFEAQEAGKTTLAAAYREAVATSERAADQWKLSAQTFAAGKKREGVRWMEEGASLQSKANYGAKASEAQEAGKTMLAAAYREAAATSQRAA
ncbi:MAG TPA: hypothetical protein VJK54_03610, partial [Chthoniobacterales bacterium]|nr:hypothetical protein [Chthoniobacterales bacterium]